MTAIIHTAVQDLSEYCTNILSDTEGKCKMAWEPWMEADRREAAWDRYCENFPRCADCGKVLLPDTKVYFDQRHSEYICMDCINDNTEYIEED